MVVVVTVVMLLVTVALIVNVYTPATVGFVQSTSLPVELYDSNAGVDGD